MGFTLVALGFIKTIRELLSRMRTFPSFISCVHITCIFPIKWANKTRPKMEKRMENAVSPINVLVDKDWPKELRNIISRKNMLKFL